MRLPGRPDADAAESGPFPGRREASCQSAPLPSHDFSALCSKSPFWLTHSFFRYVNRIDKVTKESVHSAFCCGKHFVSKMPFRYMCSSSIMCWFLKVELPKEGSLYSSHALPTELSGEAHIWRWGFMNVLLNGMWMDIPPLHCRELVKPLYSGLIRLCI